MRVADVGDLGDETLGVGAIGQQYFLFHLCHDSVCDVGTRSARARAFLLALCHKRNQKGQRAVYRVVLARKLPCSQHPVCL